MATELVLFTFRVVLLVVVTFINNTLLRPLVNYHLFAMSFFACGYVIVLGVFPFLVNNFWLNLFNLDWICVACLV